MNRKITLFLLSVMFLLTVCACSANRSYVSADVTYSEPTAQYAFRLNMDYHETEHAKYYFEPSIENKERNACIDVTDNLLSSQSFGDVIPEIYIFSKERYDYQSISDHKLYASIYDWKSAAYITDVLLTVYGEKSHYGTVFGYANALAKTQKWDAYDGKFSKPTAEDILDLSYLCFDEAFVSSDDVIAAKELSCAFVDAYIKQYGEQTFMQLLSSPDKALEALSAYYAENGITYTPSVVQYGHGGRSYDYLVYSDYGTFYIANDWVDLLADLNPLVTEGFLHTDYSNTKAFFETNLKQMKQYQDLFALDHNNNDLEIVFPKSISASNNSYYHGIDHRIYLYNVDSLMHEYIHSLTVMKSTMSGWKVEGFARYFSYYYDLYGIAMLNQDYNNTPNIPELQHIHEYSANINRPIDIAKDYSELENIVVYSRSWTSPDENYITGSSFVQYLVKQYGEAAVINFIYGDEEPLPKTYRELVKEWNEYIESNYQTYSKYQ